MKRLAVNPMAPEAVALEWAAAAIRRGGLVAFPTDTLYGLAADPFNAEAVRRVFAAKGRAAGRALLLVAADPAQVASQLGPLTPLALALAEEFWPGPLTLLVAAPKSLAKGVAGDTGSVGVRVPAYAVARELCRAAGRLLTATSANVSGQPASNDPDDVAASLGPRIEVLLDGGRCAGGPASTVVDATGPVARLVRAGAIPWDEVQACMRRA